MTQKLSDNLLVAAYCRKNYSGSLIPLEILGLIVECISSVYVWKINADDINNTHKTFSNGIGYSISMHPNPNKSIPNANKTMLFYLRANSQHFNLKRLIILFELYMPQIHYTYKNTITFEKRSYQWSIILNTSNKLTIDLFKKHAYILIQYKIDVLRVEYRSNFSSFQRLFQMKHRSKYHWYVSSKTLDLINHIIYSKPASICFSPNFGGCYSENWFFKLIHKEQRLHLSLNIISIRDDISVLKVNYSVLIRFNDNVYNRKGSLYCYSFIDSHNIKHRNLEHIIWSDCYNGMDFNLFSVDIILNVDEIIVRDYLDNTDAITHNDWEKYGIILSEKDKTKGTCDSNSVDNKLAIAIALLSFVTVAIICFTTNKSNNSPTTKDK